MTKDNNLTNRITMMIMAAFFIMLMALVPTKKVEAAGGSNFYNAQQIRFNTNYPSTTEPSEGNGYQYFKFRTGSSKATYMIKFINLDGKNPLNTCLYDENLNCVDGSVEYTYSGKTVELSNLKKNTTYYVQFASYYYFTNPLKVNYVFSVKEVLAPPAKVAISRVSAGRKKLTVKWAAAPRAKAYQVAVRKAGGKWKTYNVSSRKKSFTKLKSKTKYSVKVRGYFKTKSGAKRYGKWSSVRKVVVK